MCINYMRGEYIELPCDYYTMLTFMVRVLWAHNAHLHGVLPCVLVHALLSKQERGITWAFVMLTS